MGTISRLAVNRPWQVKRVIVSRATNKDLLDLNPGQGWSFAGGVALRSQSPSLRSFSPLKKKKKKTPNKALMASASWLPGPEVAFTAGTVAVFPFYALMVLAPHSKLTKKSMESSLPYVALGAAYVFLLYHSWTADTMRLMFAGKYWLPELSSITRMFSNELTMASAWLHLLLVDLFAARQIFRDGLEHEVETRHSVALCLFFCPVGILAHVITKQLTPRKADSSPKVVAVEDED